MVRVVGSSIDVYELDSVHPADRFFVGLATRGRGIGFPDQRGTGTFASELAVCIEPDKQEKATQTMLGQAALLPAE